MAERDIQKQILEYLEIHEGALVLRTNSGAFALEHKGRKRLVRANNQPGCSDLNVCLRGRWVAIEVKQPGKVATAKQGGYLDRVREAGGLAFVARSVRDVWTALECEGLSVVSESRFDALEAVYGL